MAAIRWLTGKEPGRPMKAALASARRRSGHAASSGGRGPLNPEAARILELQRQAGNRAVTALLTGGGRPALQRAISFTPGDLEVGRSWKDRLRTAFKSDVYSDLLKDLAKYHSSKTDYHRLIYATLVQDKCEFWLRQHDSPATANERQKKHMLVQLEAEARREVGVLRAQARYLKDLETGGMKGLSAISKLNVVAPAKALAAGQTSHGAGADQEAAALIAKAKLSAAEVAALRTYTVSDYAYINPSMSNPVAKKGETEKENVKRVAEKVQQAKDKHVKGVAPATLAQEGPVHAGVMMQALAKLKPWDGGPLYRGMRLRPGEFANWYYKGAPYSRTQFDSASKSQSVAEKYAEGTGGDIAPAKDQTVHVLLEIDVKNARDISKISAAMVKEDEVLILPGARFVVDTITPRTAGPVGHNAAPATAWYTVKMVEVA